MFCTCYIFITLQVCLLIHFLGWVLFFFFQMGKWQGALESVEWTWGSLVNIPEGSPAAKTELQWQGGIIKCSSWNQSSSYLANTCNKIGILKHLSVPAGGIISNHFYSSTRITAFPSSVWHAGCCGTTKNNKPCSHEVFKFTNWKVLKWMAGMQDVLKS